ncbi:MAG: CHAD domain-containing protein [Bryobacteraceae bacterium]|nr:CHAD domain-containing protein [Bryobacteraceae bacterium]
MQDYAAERVRSLLARFVFELNRAAKGGRDPEKIHALRVSVRRLGQALRAFHQFFPQKQVKRIRKRLRSLMRCAAAVRDRDIALALLERAGAGKGVAAEELRRERKLAERGLERELRGWMANNFSSKWRSALHLL